MAMFIAKISKGRSIRSIIFMTSIVAPILTNIWFCILGGAGLGFEIQDSGSIAQAFANFNLPAALFATLDKLPFSFLLSILMIMLSTIFMATTCDSMTYVLAMTLSKNTNPDKKLRVIIGIGMTIMAITLLNIGEGGVSKLQSFIIVTAVPVSLILIPPIFEAIKIIKNIKLKTDNE